MSEPESHLPYAVPPDAVYAREVIFVECSRGQGDLRRSVTQIYDMNGDLLAEHDWLHPDPIFAGCFLRSAAEDGKFTPPACGEDWPIGLVGASVYGLVGDAVTPVLSDIAAIRRFMHRRRTPPARK